MQPLLVLTTLGATADARAFARELVSRRLVACVNVLPQIASVYRWKGEIQEDAEQLLIMKTTAARIDALHAAVVELHPYEVPEFVVVSADQVRGPYLQWLADSVR